LLFLGRELLNNLLDRDALRLGGIQRSLAAIIGYNWKREAQRDDSEQSWL
jgi:hypothetical protein